MLCYPLNRFEQLEATWQITDKHQDQIDSVRYVCFPYILAATEQFQRLFFLNRLYCFGHQRQLHTPFLWNLWSAVDKKWFSQEIGLISWWLFFHVTPDTNANLFLWWGESGLIEFYFQIFGSNSSPFPVYIQTLLLRRNTIPFTNFT